MGGQRQVIVAEKDSRKNNEFYAQTYIEVFHVATVSVFSLGLWTNDFPSLSLGLQTERTERHLLLLRVL